MGEKVKETERQAEKVYCYFNNHYHGYAVRNCLQFAEMIRELTEEQQQARENIEGHFRDAEAAAKEKIKKRGMTLAAYMPEEVKRMDFEELLSMFMDQGRRRRAKGISDGDVRIEDISVSGVKASIRDYRPGVDTKNHVMLHDCPDWSRCAPGKQLCNHVGKVMMTLPREDAMTLMRQIAMEREKWEFKPYAS